MSRSCCRDRKEQLAWWGCRLDSIPRDSLSANLYAYLSAAVRAVECSLPLCIPPCRDNGDGPDMGLECWSRQLGSINKILTMLGSLPIDDVPGYLRVGMGTWSFGRARSVDDWEAFSGVHLHGGRVAAEAKFCVDADEIPFEVPGRVCPVVDGKIDSTE